MEKEKLEHRNNTSEKQWKQKNRKKNKKQKQNKNRLQLIHNSHMRFARVEQRS